MKTPPKPKTKKAPRPRGGRRRRLTAEQVESARMAAQVGADDKTIAALLEISMTTYTRWKQLAQHPERRKHAPLKALFRMIEKERATIKTQALQTIALHARSTKQTVIDEQGEVVLDPRTGKPKVEILKGDHRAAKELLRLVDPETYVPTLKVKAEQKTEVSGPQGQSIHVEIEWSKASVEQLAALAFGPLSGPQPLPANTPIPVPELSLPALVRRDP